MNILQIHENYKHGGGAETYFFSLCNELSKNNKVFIYSIDKNDNIRNEEKFIYKIPDNRIKRFFYSHFNFPLYIEFRRWLKLIKPDVAHLHLISEYNTTILLALKKEKIPIVQTVHDFGIVCPTTWCIRKDKVCSGGLGLKCINSWCRDIGYHGKKSYSFILFCGLREKIKEHLNKRYIDLFICPSKSLKDKMLENKFGNIVYLSNFTDKIYRTNLINSKQKNVLYIGALTKQKGVSYLVKAFRRVLEKMPNARLNIVGEYPKANIIENDGKIIHLPYFIDKPKKNILLKREQNNIVYSGRVIKQKGIDYLIKAFNIIKKKIPNAKLTILGEGEEKNKLIETSEKLKLKNIKFIGKVPNDQVQKFYKDSNIVIIPSIWMENSPMVAYEAMATGRPIIGSNIGGIPELVKDGKNGLLFEPRNSDELAYKIIKVLNNPKLARKFGDYGKDLIDKEFNKEKHIKNIIEIYNNLILVKNGWNK